jgi:hypothetical protein
MIQKATRASWHVLVQQVEVERIIDRFAALGVGDNRRLRLH